MVAVAVSEQSWASSLSPSAVAEQGWWSGRRTRGGQTGGAGLVCGGRADLALDSRSVNMARRGLVVSLVRRVGGAGLVAVADWWSRASRGLAVEEQGWSPSPSRSRAGPRHCRRRPSRSRAGGVVGELAVADWWSRACCGGRADLALDSRSVNMARRGLVVSLVRDLGVLIFADLPPSSDVPPLPIEESRRLAVVHQVER
nr:hypothetical protein Iba_chr07fCG3270 [Ipomoea batatas]